MVLLFNYMHIASPLVLHHDVRDWNWQMLSLLWNFIKVEHIMVLLFNYMHIASPLVLDHDVRDWNWQTH